MSGCTNFRCFLIQSTASIDSLYLVGTLSKQQKLHIKTNLTDGELNYIINQSTMATNTGSINISGAALWTAERPFSRRVLAFKTLPTIFEIGLYFYIFVNNSKTY